MASFDAYEGSDLDSTRPFDDGYLGYDPRLPSNRFDSFRVSDHYGDEHDHFSSVDEVKEEEDGGNGYDNIAEPPVFQSGFLEEPPTSDAPSPYAESFDSATFQSRHDFSPEGFAIGEENGEFGFSDQPLFGSSNGAVLPPPEHMEPEEGFLLQEWKRQNALHLEEKQKKERERLSQIMDEADDYKSSHYSKRKGHCETSKMNNREKEKVFLSNQEHFHATAEKHYWKAVAELIPNELPAFETKSRTANKKKAPVIFNQGPKPGKPTDLARMRQILLKLKHNPPSHMKTAPPPPPPAKNPAESEAPASAPLAAGQEVSVA